MVDCVSPFYLKSQDIYVRCGKCLLCRLHTRREWTLRIQLEATCHQDNSFCTLTYDDNHVPPELYVRDFQLFMKRLRKIYKKPIRYFMAAEYGDNTHRPHFHLILFGFSFKDREYLERAWSLGFVQIDPLTPDRANYTCGYVQKKFDYISNRVNYYRQYPDLSLEQRVELARYNNDVDALVERQPFATSSKRPALGLTWYEQNKNWLKNSNFIAYKGQRYPIPRYFKELLIAEFPEYKERLLAVMQDVEAKQKAEYQARFNYTFLDIEFAEHYKDVMRQKQIDIAKKNEFYLIKKRSKKYASKVL